MLDVEVTPRAAIQLEAAATWWANNRPAAPDAIRVDFQQATALLLRQPGVGAKSSTARYPDLRRLFLSRVRYHIYFNTGVRKTVDFSRWLRGPVFEPLRGREAFRKFFIGGGTVCWPNGADIAPETLYAEQSVSNRAA